MEQGNISDENWAQIQKHLYDGKKIEAIKLYRQLTSLSLKDAKDAMDQLETELREKYPERFAHLPAKSGCSLMLVFLALAVGALHF